MEISDLRQNPGERAQVHDLIARVFPTGALLSRAVPLDIEFPLLLSPGNAQRVLFVRAQGRVVASASYRIFDVPCGAAHQPVRCAAVGLVVTDPAHRKQGHSRALQQEIEKRALTEGAVLSMLWSDQIEFYERLGYMAVGAELQWFIDGKDFQDLPQRLAPPPAGSHTARLSSFADTLALYNEGRWGPQRSSSDYEAFMKLSDCALVAAYDEQKTIRAYAAIGKGRDLPNTLHEIQGDPSYAPALLRAVHPLAHGQLRVQLPVGHPWVPTFGALLGPGKKGPLALMKALQPAALAAFVQHFYPQLTFRWAKDRLQIASKHGIFFESDESAHLLQLFWGPWEITEMTGLPPLLTQELGGVPLLPFYMWGFDSV